MGREVVIAVSGGIAAYKAATLVSRLVQSGVGVSVVLTPAGAKFVQPATFAALSGRPVATEIFDEGAFPLGAHIELAKRAELLCVAPATADFLAKGALGMADDLLSTLWLAFSGPRMFAPAMNAAMWSKPAVQRNIQTILADGGAEMISPGEGWQSCRDQGAGRMAEPEEIAKVILQRLKK